jgi:hypothetical protein
MWHQWLECPVNTNICTELKLTTCNQATIFILLPDLTFDRYTVVLFEDLMSQRIQTLYHIMWFGSNETLIYLNQVIMHNMPQNKQGWKL